MDLGIEDYLGKGEAISANILSQQTDEPLANEVKDRLQDMLGYLEKDVVDLVRDAEPIRSAFRAIKDQLSPELFSALSLVAYIEGHESKIVEAKNRLADRLTYQQLAEQKNFKKQEVIELRQKLEDLKKTPTQIDETINRLKVEESRPEGLLVRVRAAIDSEEQNKAKVPELISKAVEEMKTKAQQLPAVYKEIKPDSGIADENIQVVKEVNEIRLRAVKMIQDALCL